MKKWIIITVSLCFTFLSCKNNGNENSYCVNIIRNSPTITTLSESEMDVIKYLFNHNQLDYTKYQFTQFQEDNLGNRHVRCYQFANNLIIFTSDLIFHFDKNDNYITWTGNWIYEVNLDTIASIGLLVRYFNPPPLGVWSIESCYYCLL